MRTPGVGFNGGKGGGNLSDTPIFRRSGTGGGGAGKGFDITGEVGGFIPDGGGGQRGVFSVTGSTAPSSGGAGSVEITFFNSDPRSA